MTQLIEITLAGTVTFRVGDGTVRELGLGPRGRVAFAYLVVERHRRVARDELADAIWGEDLPDTWRSALRVLLSRLRGALADGGLSGGDVLRHVAGCYELCLPGAVRVDVEAAASDLVSAAAALAGGDAGESYRLAARAATVARARFLPAETGAWVEARQAALRRALLEALDLASRSAAACGDHGAAVQSAEEAVALEPWDETAHLRLVGSLDASGNRAAARRAAERCRTVLAGELGVPPSADAEARFARLAEPAPGNLRRPVSSFVGRNGELVELARLAAANRMLTLVGPAGVGKSRLAVELADRRAAAYPDGAWLVELAGVAPGGSVARHASAVLGLAEDGEDAGDGLAVHLAGRRALLVLDNCEHVVPSCAAVAEVLVGCCPGVDVLATSREPLGVAGEVVCTVQPLSVPAGDDGLLADLLSFDAVRLFVERAASAVPAVDLEPVSGSVARICRQLDGLPLAIELTAARTRSVGVQEIDALVSGGRRSLQAALDWSHGTLGADERTVLAHVALFVGGFRLGGARAVCPLPADRLVDALAGLVDKSLVVVDRDQGDVRYRLLETVRRYGLAKLADQGGTVEGAGRDRHLAWACELAETAEPGLDGPDQAVWLAALDREEENLGAALDWAARSGAGTLGSRLAVALWRFWEIRGRLTEGRARLEAWAGHGRAPARVRARALNGAGILAQRQSDWAAARRLYEASLAAHLALGDRRGAAAARNGLANLSVSAGRFDVAERLYGENVALGRALGDDRLVASSLLNLAVVYQFLATAGTLDRHQALGIARGHCEHALLRYRALGDQHSQAMALENLGSLLALLGDVCGSRRCLDESLALRRSLGDRVGVAASARFLGHLARRDGRYDTARSLHEESLSLECELGNAVLAATDLLALGEIATDQAAFDDARGFLERSLVMYRGLGDDAGSERALSALVALPLANR